MAMETLVTHIKQYGTGLNLGYKENLALPPITALLAFYSNCYQLVITTMRLPYTLIA